MCSRRPEAEVSADETARTAEGDGPRRARPARVEWGCRLALLAASALVAAALGELALRVCGYSFPAFFARDPVFGTALVPLAEGRWRHEGSSHVRINRDGYRDRDHTVAKPPGTVRVAVLGDSFTEAFQVEQEDAFWAVMERDLERVLAASHRRAEVLSFGVSGFNPTQELLLLRERVWRYTPDVVVLAVFTGNDVRDSHPALAPLDGRPYFHLRDGRLVLDPIPPEAAVSDSAPARTLRWLRRHSRLAQLVAELRRRRMEQERSRDLSAASPAGLPWPIQGRENLYVPPRDESWHAAWEVMEAVIREIAHETSDHGARLVVVTLSNPEQVWPDPAVRAAFARALGAPDLGYPDRRIAELGRSAGFEVVTLAPALAAYATSHGTVLHLGEHARSGGGHWNATAHRVAGELLAERLLAAGVLDPGR
jgi:hypothetical protein